MDEIQTAENAERQEVFRGHFDECLEHLGQCFDAHFPKGSTGVDKARQPIADFCGVVVSTVRGWFNRPSSSIGESKVNMMCFLDLIGYHVLELENLKDTRELAELIGYRVISVPQAQELMCYGDAKSVYDTIFSRVGMSEIRKERMRNICRERRAELAQKKEEARQKCQLGFSLTEHVEQRKVSAVMSIMDGLLAMLDSRGIGDSFLAGLRDLSSSEKKTLLRLAERLDSLSIRLARASHGVEETDGK